MSHGKRLRLVIFEVITQSEIDSVRGWCATNHVKLNVDKNSVFIFTVVSGAFNYDCRLLDGCVTCSDSVGDLGVRVDCKRCFNTYATYTFSQSFKNVRIHVYQDLFFF
jgi:hypothetical protein